MAHYSSRRIAASETNGMGHPVITIARASYYPRRYMPDTARVMDGFTITPGGSKLANEAGYERSVNWVQAMIMLVGSAGELKREVIERYIQPAPSYLNASYGYTRGQRLGAGKNRSRTRAFYFEPTGKCGMFRLTVTGEHVYDQILSGVAEREYAESTKEQYDTEWGW